MWDILTLCKALAICLKGYSSSSVTVSLVGCHILYGVNFTFTGMSTQIITFIIDVGTLTDSVILGEMLMNSH